MLPYLDPAVPVAYIYNNIESFFEFLNRSETSSLPRPHPYRPTRQYSKGDRGLLSLGGRKLVFTSAEVPHANYVRQTLGYTETDYAYPANPSPWLCLDMLQEPALLNRLASYAGAARVLQLVPYATTRQFLQLVYSLRTDHGLTVLLPESPEPGAEWVKDYIDTKAGFRSLASRWLPDAQRLMPAGFVCNSALQAAEVVLWFNARGQACVVKADGGESGIGHRIFHPHASLALQNVFDELRTDPYLQGDTMIVEELIDAPEHLSPSLEVYVPPRGQGEPVITYLSNQLFLGFSDFYGLLVGAELMRSPWYKPLAESGLTLARELQRMGYAGHFDLDTVVDHSGRLYLLELNSRRTAGTHVHEFAYHHFGPDYLDKVVLLSVNKIKTGAISRLDELQATLRDLLYPMEGRPQGLIFAVTSILQANEFGCIIVGPSTESVMALHAQMRARLQAGSGEEASR